jgi:arginase family enzyme
LRSLNEQPDATALCCGPVTLTNSALKQRAITVAQRVRAIAEDEREIAVVVGRDHQLVVAIVAAEAYVGAHHLSRRLSGLEEQLKDPRGD